MTEGQIAEKDHKVESVETKRGRVRRLLIDPLVDHGFVFKRGTTDSDQIKKLNHLTDNLAYMSDRGLMALRECLATKGDGSRRNFWPSPATVIGHAEAFEPRPLIENPNLLSWFQSRAGEAALSGNRLYAEYLFWQRFKRPPATPTDQKRVADKAAELNDRAERIRDKMRRGAGVLEGDAEFLSHMERCVASVTELVKQGQERRR